MSHTIREIASALGLNAAGDLDIPIHGAAEPATATPSDLALAMAPAYAEGLNEGSARAAILWTGADWRGLGLEAALFVDRPRLAMSGVTRMFDPGQGQVGGIHPSAVIEPDAELGENVSVGALAYIGSGAKIGAGSVIGPHCVIGAGAGIGPDAFLRDSVSVGARVQIGARFICQPGARIGVDGFSFVTPELSTTEAARATMGDSGDAAGQAYVRIHSLGSVVIGDDVEIGANCTIDSGTIRDTMIGEGTKLDDMVHVGHNCRIGRHCLLCGQAGLSGSVTVGDFAVLAGQTGVADNSIIGERAILTGGTKATSTVPPGQVMMGYPAVKLTQFTEIYKALRRLPRLARQVAELQKAVSKDSRSD